VGSSAREDNKEKERKKKEKKGSFCSRQEKTRYTDRQTDRQVHITITTTTTTDADAVAQSALPLFLPRNVLSAVPRPSNALPLPVSPSPKGDVPSRDPAPGGPPSSRSSVISIRSPTPPTPLPSAPTEARGPREEEGWGWG
jgi:hypothetical protein